MSYKKFREQDCVIARNITFEQGQYKLLKNINLSIPKGMVTLFVGHNGSGKSLLMQILHGIIKPTDGHIDSISAKEQRFVFQNPVVLNRTASKNFDFVAPFCARNEKLKWFQKSGLTGRMNTHAPLLSGGEKQKLALISAFASNPNLIFLDEPCANIDYKATQFIEKEILEARECGKTIVMSTHNKSQAERLGDYIILLERGKIIETSEKLDFFKNPKTESAKKYLKLA